MYKNDMQAMLEKTGDSIRAGLSFVALRAAIMNSSEEVDKNENNLL